MMRRRVVRSLLIAAFAAVAACHDPLAEPAEAASPVKLGLTTVQLVTSDGKTHSYKAEIARTPEEQARGLMFRRSMPRNAGMLFPFEPARPASFWMENTYIPLDIIFIGPDRRVLNVGSGKPLSPASVSSAGTAGAVLELNAGEAARIGLKPGDAVRWADK